MSPVLQLYYAKHEDKQEGKDKGKYKKRVIEMTKELLQKVDPNGMKVRAAKELLALARGKKPDSHATSTAHIRLRSIPEHDENGLIPILPVIQARFLGKAFTLVWLTMLSTSVLQHYNLIVRLKG